MTDEEPEGREVTGSEPLIDGVEDLQVDRTLREVGEGIRASASPIGGHEIIVKSLRRQLHRTRVLSIAMIGVASLLVVALAGALIVTARRNEPPSLGKASSGTVSGFASGAAAKFVDSLPPEPVDPAKVKLVASVARYDTCDLLLDQLRRTGAEHVGSQGFGNLGYVTPYNVGMGMGRMSAADYGYSAGVESDSKSLAFSDESGVGETQGTNVIVAGVDEPDSVKAVGSLVLEIAGPNLRITDTSIPAVVGEVTMGTSEPADAANQYALIRRADSILVNGSRAIVFGIESVPEPPIADDPSAARPYVDYVTLTTVDFSDPSQPKVIDTVRIEGGLVAARRVGDQVRIVTTSDLAELPMVLPARAPSVAPALRQNRLVVAESTVQDWIPDWDHGKGTESKPLVGCGDVVVPDTFAGVQMTSLVEFDINKDFEPRSMSILAPSETITASATDVLVASHIWVDRAKQKADFSDWATALHRFEFTEAGPAYVGSGKVDGSVRDSFSLSVIDENTVGVVTVDVLPWKEQDKATVAVHTLSTDRGTHKLVQIGVIKPTAAVAGVAGVRFVGAQVLMATGPLSTGLVVVDLSDPSAPSERGSVDLGGTGEYIHPIPDGRILIKGVTFRSVGERIDQGVQALVIDLSAAPVVVARWSIDNASSYSYSGEQHHSFTWWRSHSTAVFPIRQFLGYPSYNSLPPEAVFLSVGADTLTPRRVTPHEADLGPRCRLGQEDLGCDASGPPEVRRILIVNGDPWLYTSESLEHLEPETLQSLALVSLPLRIG